MTTRQAGDREHGERIEPRWPVVLTVLAVTILLTLLPQRLRLFPQWLPYAIAAAVLTPILGVPLARDRARWQRFENRLTLLFCTFMIAGTLMNLANLIGAMMFRQEGVSGRVLLASSIGVWVTNVLAFSLLYWQMDRGGPSHRASGAGPRPDWLFPQEGAPPEDIPPGWHPTFVDYLFLGFTTATAFSPTEALPLTSRAKLLMMLEGAISLTTLVVVAARAINILGG